jgi:hypothetical protein
MRTGITPNLQIRSQSLYPIELWAPGNTKCAPNHGPWSTLTMRHSTKIAIRNQPTDMANESIKNSSCRRYRRRLQEQAQSVPPE